MMHQRNRGSGFGQKCHCGSGVGPGRGATGTSVCSACGHQVPHQPGVPCQEVKCPRCNGAMTRRD